MGLAPRFVTVLYHVLSAARGRPHARAWTKHRTSAARFDGANERNGAFCCVTVSRAMNNAFAC